MLDTSNNNLEGKDVIFLSAWLDPTTQKLMLKLFSIEENKIYLVEDLSFFKGFFYVKKDDINEDVLRKFLKENPQFEIQVKEIFDGISNKKIFVYKFMSYNIYDIYRRYTNVFNIQYQYEYLIKFYESYYLTKGLIPCAIYEFQNATLYRKKYPLTEVAINTLEKMLKNVKHDTYRMYLSEYTDLLGQPIPMIKRCAIDIEVLHEENQFPNIFNPISPVVCISFYDNVGFKQVIVAKNLISPDKFDPEDRYHDYIKFVDTEEDLLRETFEIMNSYPIVLTYNGDDFDLAYIHQRSKKFEKLMDIRRLVHFHPKPENYARNIKEPVHLTNSLHLDLYRLFYNTSLHNYGFNHKYVQFGLDPVSKALLGEGKIKNDKAIYQLNVNDLCKYCLKDSELTLRLTTYNDDMVMKLLFTIARITKTSIEDVDRYGISTWARSMLYYEHRRWDVLIPDRAELKTGKGIGSTHAVMEGKKFQGAVVMEPKEGMYFNVVTLDYASLYPSIIKRYNISYETINCNHEKCKQNNKIPFTTHHYCVKRIGMLSLLIGVLRDLRVNYFKKLSKDKSLTEAQRDLYDSITQASKVILNGSYGVIGSEAFNMYCLPVAESVTALGRDIIMKTKEYAETKLNLNVLYGDTDSIFVLDPSQEQISKLIDFSKGQFDIDLEVDKEFKFAVFSNRKKNYFGVYKNGLLETKGLTGKKSHIPDYVKRCFNDVTDLLKTVDKPEKINLVLKEIEEVVNNYIVDLRNNKVELRELVFNFMLKKDIEEYGEVVSKGVDLNGNEVIKKKGVPAHIKAAMELQKLLGENIEQKTFIPFIKTKQGAKLMYTGEKVINHSNNINKQDIDIDVYIDTFKTALVPILEVLGLKFKDIIDQTKKQQSLFSFFEE